jgi:sugar/nucleoside kinase (ribokinase family)
LWDLHGDGPLERAKHFTRMLGGAAANVAFGLRRAGLEVAVAGVVGRDRFGAGLAAALAARGVDVSAVVARPGQTGAVFIEPLSPAGQRFASYRPSARWPARLALPAPWRRGSLEGAWLHVAAVDPEAAAPLADLAARLRRRGASVSVDLNARPRAWRRRRGLPAAARRLLAAAAVVKASADDLHVLGAASLPLTADAVMVLTRGARSCRVVLDGRALVVAPPRVAAVRAVGAGDAFMARLLVELHARGVSHEGVGRDARFWRRAVAAACAEAAAHVAAAVTPPR